MEEQNWQNVTYPIFVQELELNLHVRPQLFEFLPLFVEDLLSLSLFVLIHLGLWGTRVKFQVRLVGIELNPAVIKYIKGFLMNVSRPKREILGLLACKSCLHIE